MLDRLEPARIERLSAPDTQNTEWLDVSSNNHGFFSKHDYPYRPASSGEYIIGVFGGSVAHWFALQGGRALAAKLSTRIGGNRTVKVLNFGVGAFKQPQSAFAFLYFLMLGQRFDAVILLDGFNEAALSWTNSERGVASAWPSVSHMDLFAGVPCLHEFKSQPGLSRAEVIQEIAAAWEEGARVIHDACQSRGIAFFHVLQPNQYHCRKTFSEEERQFALSETSPYRQGVETMYPEFASRMRDKFKWKAIDATAVFDNCRDTVYSDNCCHYNHRGNAILGVFILKGMLETRISPGRVRRWWSGRKRTALSGSSAGKDDMLKRKDDLYPMW